jgi:hypothetical protein
MQLPSGKTYVIVAVTSEIVSRCSPANVSVTPGPTMQADLNCES